MIVISKSELEERILFLNQLNFPDIADELSNLLQQSKPLQQEIDEFAVEFGIFIRGLRADVFHGNPTTESLLQLYKDHLNNLKHTADEK